MQTRLQFDNTSTLQEWNSFKGILQKGSAGKPLNGKSSSENLIFHLSKQLEGGGILKETKMIIPIFPESLRQAS